MDGWIKLHRKLLNNDELFRGGSTFPVFCLLLLLADRQGKIRAGRFFLAKWLKINPNTLYKALRRLKSLHILDMESNNKGTTISILNWGVYQQQGNNKVTPKQQQGNTLQEYKNKNKNKEIIHTQRGEASVDYLKSIPEQDLKDFASTYKATTSQVETKAESLYNYCEAKGKVYRDYKALLRNSLLRDYGRRGVISAEGARLQKIVGGDRYAKS